MIGFKVIESKMFFINIMPFKNVWRYDTMPLKN